MRSLCAALLVVCWTVLVVTAKPSGDAEWHTNWYMMRMLNRLPSKRNFFMAQYADNGLNSLAEKYGLGSPHSKRSVALEDDGWSGSKRNWDSDLLDPTADFTIKFGKRNAAAENLEDVILRLGRR
uniref:Organ specific protein n=1 Tax=Steinernema glaseri TaxID=37863 RepID=A0A1I7ZPJ2_9BILA